jgi:hypothetical protein
VDVKAEAEEQKLKSASLNQRGDGKGSEQAGRDAILISAGDDSKEEGIKINAFWIPYVHFGV